VSESSRLGGGRFTLAGWVTIQSVLTDIQGKGFCIGIIRHGDNPNDTGFNVIDSRHKVGILPDAGTMKARFRHSFHHYVIEFAVIIPHV
ncbi:MAG: hypothetical protein G5703_06000, partial [Serratia symbiotica]|nr:hypothetical protein [Serratia symbiotica]